MPRSLLDLIDTYNCDEACRELLCDLRWPHGIACVRCGSTSVSDLRTRTVFDCNDCRHQFSVTAGTIMHDTHLPLRKWFVAIYLMCESKKGVSAKQLERVLDVAYQTAWYLSHRIRKAMADNPLEGPTLVGVVEVDETLVGGKAKGKGMGYRGNKFWVAGAIQRDGQVRLEQVPNVRKHTLAEFIGRNISPEAEAVYTDELASYIGTSDRWPHETVNHGCEQWVVGDVHTNTIEGVWSLFKRSLVGSFPKVSVKHIDRYVSELEWRFNNRDNPRIFVDTLHRIATTGAMPYSELIADTEAA